MAESDLLGFELTVCSLLWKVSTGIFFFHGWRSFPHLNIKVWQVFPTYLGHNHACYLLIRSRVITIKSWKSFLMLSTSFNMIPSFVNNHKGKKKPKGKCLCWILYFWEKDEFYCYCITLTWKTSYPQKSRPNDRPNHVQREEDSPARKLGDLGSMSNSITPCAFKSLVWHLWTSVSLGMEEGLQAMKYVPVLKLYFH